MTRTTSTTKHTAAREARTRPAIPAPRRSPEQGPAQPREPEPPADLPPYPLVRYALEHATALRPRRD
ncbi:hypothetical protein [Petropleomorpha daqingensis]|uniref:Uncharacterized protein n=1 Tax=Petropleomorpha daqingensis TaxID=2026353 RepID=A0A853CQT9_9ACTN|nr:hypothetical protein [Petropleomorpha daqingensis]NYJ08293.1 hypothetical protein [Petropleomorpha daqingensis]